MKNISLFQPVCFCILSTLVILYNMGKDGFDSTTQFLALTAFTLILTFLIGIGIELLGTWLKKKLEQEK